MTRPHRAQTPADQVAVIIAPHGVWLPSSPPFGAGGEPLMGPVASVDHLGQGLTWLTEHGYLQTHGTIAQAWVLGTDAVDALGWLVDPGQQAKGVTMRQLQDQTRERLAEAVQAALPTLEARGWTLRSGWETGGYRVRLERLPVGPRSRPRGRGAPAERKVRVDVVLEPFAWTTGGSVHDADEREMLGLLGGEANGTGLPDTETDPDAARVELGRRMSWCVQHLSMLPGVTGSATGAAIAERIWRAAEDRNAEIQAKLDAGKTTKEAPSVFPTSPGGLPPLTEPPPGDIEPLVSWARLPDHAEIERADRIVIADQRAAHLAGGGAKLALGHPVPVAPADLDAVLWFSGEDKPARWPCGLWRVVLPPPAEVPGWDVLPPLHQTWWETGQADPQAYPAVWVTTETLAALAADPDKGGLGLAWCRDHVPILEGITYPEAGPALKPWQSLMSAAYRAAVAEGDRAMKALTGDIYKGYFGRWAQTPDQWGQYRARHSQRIWYNQIHALTTARTRRKAADAAARTEAAGYGPVYPVRANTDDCTYLVPTGMDAALLADDDSDGKFYLGRTVIKHQIPITETGRAALLAATTAKEFAAAVDAAFTETAQARAAVSA
ncbi:hypothetical protein [Nocardia sp. NPDC050435]|uniref:hypothetical protein n=1 Tax=Nocardia sp. NPDC050435 TaxID=3155040 RepID=UPI0033DC8002